MADPWIMKLGEFYYLYGTACPGNNAIDWTPLWKSRDMVNWSGPYKLYQGNPQHFWASERYHYRNNYYVIITCGHGKLKNTHYKLLKSPSPEGPYSLFTALPFSQLDPHIFIDTNGQSYLLSNNKIAKLSADWKTLGPWKDDTYNKEVREGPFMIKNNNDYHIFRAWNKSPDGPKGYEMMIGFAHTITGKYWIYRILWKPCL